MIEQATQVFAAVSFLVIGLSHVAHPKLWVAFYQALAARGNAGVFLEGFLLVNFGAIIVSFHNVWRGPAIVLTVIGWMQVLKGVSRFLLPHIGLRIMQRVSDERAWHFRVGGLISLGISGFLWWLRFRP